MRNEMLSVFIGLLIADLSVLGLLLWMPVMRREKSFFGVRVSREIYLGEGRRVLWRYRLCVLAAFVAFGAVGYLTAYFRHDYIYAVLSYIVTIPVALALYANFAREMRPFRITSEGTRFATPLNTRQLSNYTTPALEVLIAILCIVPVVMLVYYYPALPERIPVHWGVTGEPDRWARKSFSTVFFMPVLAIYLQSWFLLLKYDMAHAKMTLPAEKAELYLSYKEQTLTAMMRMTDWVRGMVALLLSLVSLFLLITTVERLRYLLPATNIAVWSGLALLLGSTFYYLYRLMAINAALEEATGNADVRRESEEEKWSGGGLFYYNPDDPALIVEKRDGLGYTYNFAGKGIKLRLAFLAVVPFLVLWALMDL